jgi:hypothetical protein
MNSEFARWRFSLTYSWVRLHALRNFLRAVRRMTLGVSLRS